jgi:hypothetical protein
MAVHLPLLSVVKYTNGPVTLLQFRSVTLIKGDFSVITNLKSDSVCKIFVDSLCDLVVRVPGYRSRGPSLILGATSFSEK